MLMHLFRFSGRQQSGGKIFLFILACFLLTGSAGIGTGNLLITPRRVVFEGNKRSFDLNLANTGQTSATYAISIIQIRMTENGGFEEITEPDPGQKFADRFIRFFPRSVTLGPNESQVVKVQLIRSGELEAGEYRSHFYFRAVPEINPAGEKEEKRDTTSISVRLTPVFGITIPVIIRVGELTAKTEITNLSLDTDQNGQFILSMTFNRTGNASVYGDLTVDHLSPDGRITRVGIANGLAVYTPNTVRHFRLILNKTQGVDFSSGTLKVTYSAPSDTKPQKFAEAELRLKQ